jgi:hypothetical protein
VRFPLRERQPGVGGCPADIRTEAGAYEGYQVVFGCLDRGDSDSVLIVRGAGRKSFRQLMGTTPGEDEDAEKQAWGRFTENLRETAAVSSIDRSSRIPTCHSTGYAIELRLHDFRQVDDAVHNVGEWLARMNVGGEIMLVLAPRPEPGDSP